MLSNNIEVKLLMGFDPLASGVTADYSTNCSLAYAHCLGLFILQPHFNRSTDNIVKVKSNLIRPFPICFSYLMLGQLSEEIFHSISMHS